MSEADRIAAEKTYREIGRFIYEFSQVEYTLLDFVGQEIGLDDKHFSAVVESYDTAVLCTVAERVFEKSLSKARFDKMRKLVNKFRDLITERNRVAHGLWVPFKDGGTVHHVSRNKLKPDILANRAAALEKLADEACNIRAEMERVFSVLDGNPNYDL
jgi:hypothetical protein